MRVKEIPANVVCPGCRKRVQVTFQPPYEGRVLEQGYQGQKRICPACKAPFVVDVVVYTASPARRDLRHPHACWIGFFQDLIEQYGAAVAVLSLYEGFKAGGLGRADARRVADATKSG